MVKKCKVVLVTIILALFISTPDFASNSVNKADDKLFTLVEAESRSEAVEPQPETARNDEDYIANQKKDTSTEFVLSEVTFVGEGGQNTSINNSILMENGLSCQGTLDYPGQTRWYGFFNNSQSEASIRLQTEDSLDADLFLYLLDMESMKINIVDKSVSTGPGVGEEISSLLEKGVYYIAVSGFQGEGGFTLEYAE